MRSRYETNDTKKTKDGRIVYKVKRYANIPLRESDVYVATETGDRLDTLANHFYGHASLWWIIATANNIHNSKIKKLKYLLRKEVAGERVYKKPTNGEGESFSNYSLFNIIVPN